MDLSVFPKWTNLVKPVLAVILLTVPLYAGSVLYYGGSPLTTDIGYAPEQPVAYSHALHAGSLGIDCRYCHNTVEQAGHAAIPPTQTCMNCHNMVRPDSEKIIPLKKSQATGMPVEWIRVHDLPDYVYFNHSAHVTRGVSCVSCHDRVDRMDVVTQATPLSMGWCLECHRNPAPNLRPPEFITQLDWQPSEAPEVIGQRIMEQNNIKPSTDCTTCHR